MKQLYKNTIIAYSVLVSLIIFYLFFGTVTTTMKYPIDIKTNQDMGRSGFSVKKIININILTNPPTLQIGDSYGLSYTIVEKGKKTNIDGIKVLAIRAEGQKAIYSVQLDSQEAESSIVHDNIIDCYLTIRNKKNVFETLFKNITNPFKN